VQQSRADFDTGFATAAMTAAGCSMQFVLPNRTPLPATRVAGLVQIANPLIETLLQVILDAFASCGRITAYPTTAYPSVTHE
jgi:acyl-CoA reductase-like NAD-dependent aldehyde dehydrogenase